MAKFKSFVGKQVMLSSSIFTFSEEEVETEDKELIAALSNAQGVEALDATKKDKKEPAQ